MKIALEYDQVTGSISLNDGAIIATWTGIDVDAHSVSVETGGVKVDELTKLKDAGFDAAEIIDLHRRGIIG